MVNLSIVTLTVPAILTMDLVLRGPATTIGDGALMIAPFLPSSFRFLSNDDLLRVGPRRHVNSVARNGHGHRGLDRRKTTPSAARLHTQRGRRGALFPPKDNKTKRHYYEPQTYR